MQNTIQFFANNIRYFAQHALEFQRLIAQLPSHDLQSQFQQIVYNYFYADILLELILLRAQSKSQSVFSPVQETFTPEMLAAQYSGNQGPESLVQSTNPGRVASVYRRLSQLKTSNKNDEQEIHKLLLQCNSRNSHLGSFVA